MRILKHFKKQRKFKSGLSERKWQPNFIENGILVSKNSKDERLDDLKSFKKTEVGKTFENEVRKLFLKSKEKNFEGVARGSKSGHAKGSLTVRMGA